MRLIQMNPDASLFLVALGEIVAVVDDIDAVVEHVVVVLCGWIDSVQRLLAVFHDEIVGHIYPSNRYCHDHSGDR